MNRCDHWWNNGAWWALIGALACGLAIGFALAEVVAS